MGSVASLKWRFPAGDRPVDPIRKGRVCKKSTDIDLEPSTFTLGKFYPPYVAIHLALR
jgi:hypothetical protein